jgi:hypothetical protein
MNNNHFWLYGAYEYRMQTSHDQARHFVFKMIDKLVEKMYKMHAESAASVSMRLDQPVGNNQPSSAALMMGRRQMSSASPAEFLVGGSPPGSAPSRAGAAACGGGNSLGTTPKGHLIFDLIATKKHVGAVPEDGLPFLLGRDIYGYVEEKYSSDVATTFVGLTDNTARRVGRDIFYTKSDELSRTRIPFAAIDREHLFIIFPLQSKKEEEQEVSAPAATPPGGQRPTSPTKRPGGSASGSAVRGPVRFQS